MQYIRLSENYSNNILIPALESPYKYIQDNNKPYFISMMKYDEKQFTEWKKTNSLKGMSGSTTDRIWADFDSKNVVDAFNDAKVFYQRLRDLGIQDQNIQISFSGNKGVGFIVDIEDDLKLDEVTGITEKLSEGLNTFDKSMYDNQRIFRLTFTKNEKSGLYKIPLTPEELLGSNLDNILESSKRITDFDKDEIKKYYKKFKPNSKYNELKNKIKKVEVKEIKLTKTDIPGESKTLPRGWKPYKWSLAQGFFESGERHNALLVLAATCRGLGYDKQTAYYMCKAALKKQAARTGTSEFDKTELWENIIEKTVYADNWEGGQFSPQTHPWLKDYCKKMGFEVTEKDDRNTTDITEAFDQFKDYATNIDALTIKTGIPALDKKLRMTVGMSVGLIAAPGVGKTSIAIQMLNNMSRSGHRAVFFSYDMYSALVYQKLIQKHFNIFPDEIFRRFKNDNNFMNQVKEKLKQEYSNVDFCFRAGQTAEDILDTIKESEEKSGQKVKFIVMDYNELVLTNFNDPTVSSSFVAQKMREYANIQQLCVLSLFQPNKMAGTPSDDIHSYRSAKGSSAIEQSCSVMLGMSRPGFNPREPEKDQFISINCLKNRMGPIFSADLHWEGLTGSVRELTEEERDMLTEIRRQQDEKEGEWK